MAEKNSIPGISTPIIGDDIDKYYLNKVWLADVKDVTRDPLVTPFGSASGSGIGGPEDPPKPPTDARPQLDDIQKPIKQEIYYENNVAKVKVSMRVYISTDEPVKKFQIKSTKPVSQGGTA
jgi:hypothetical protein